MDRDNTGGRLAYGAVAAATLCYTCLMFIWFSLPAYLPAIIADLGLTGTEAGVLAGAIPLTYIPLALFSGLLVDRVGPVRGVAAGTVVFGLAQVGRGLVATFAPMLALTVLIGVGATMITFGLPKLVSLLFPPERTGPPSAVYLVGAQAGTAGVFAIGRPAIGPLLGGWRPLFVWSGVAAIGYALVWLLVARLAPIRFGATGEGASYSIGEITDDVAAIVSHRELRLLVVVGTMYLFVLHGLQGWLPTILESRGYAAAVAGPTASLLVVANVSGVLTVPIVADRMGVRREAMVVCGVLIFAGLAGILAGGSGPALLAGILAVGLGVGGLSPLVRAIPPSYDAIGPRRTASAVGFVFAVGEVGGFLGPVTIGTSVEIWSSYAPGLALLGGAGVVVTLVAWRMQDV